MTAFTVKSISSHMALFEIKSDSKLKQKWNFKNRRGTEAKFLKTKSIPGLLQ